MRGWQQLTWTASFGLWHLGSQLGMCQVTLPLPFISFLLNKKKVFIDEIFAECELSRSKKKAVDKKNLETPLSTNYVQWLKEMEGLKCFPATRSYTVLAISHDQLNVVWSCHNLSIRPESQVAGNPITSGIWPCQRCVEQTDQCYLAFSVPCLFHIEGHCLLLIISWF